MQGNDSLFAFCRCRPCDAGEGLSYPNITSEDALLGDDFTANNFVVIGLVHCASGSVVLLVV